MNRDGIHSDTQYNTYGYFAKSVLDCGSIGLQIGSRALGRESVGNEVWLDSAVSCLC